MSTTLGRRLAILGAAGALVVPALTGCGSSGGGKATTAAGPSASSTSVEGVSLSRDDALFHALPASVRDRGSLRVAIDPPLPPYEYFQGADESKLIGFDPDLGRAIAAVLGVRFDFQRQPFDGIIPALQAGKYDVVLSSMTDNKLREQVLDFVDYTRTGLVMVVAKGNPQHIATRADLCGKTVAVQRGTTDEQFLDASSKACTDAGKPAISKLAFPKEADAFLSVKSGKAVGDFVDAATGGYAAKTIDGGSSLQIVIDPAAPHGYQANPVGIGILRGNAATRDAIKGALERVMASGAYRKLLARYGMTNNAIDHVSVNGAS